MNQDTIIVFGKRTVLTYDSAREIQEWETIQYADLARYLNQAHHIFGFKIEYKLETLTRFGLNGQHAKIATIDLRHQADTLTPLLFANNVIYRNLRTPRNTLDALIALIGIAQANGVLYLTQETYVNFPPQKELNYA